MWEIGKLKRERGGRREECTTRQQRHRETTMARFYLD